MTDQEISEALRQSVDGLLLMSESDYPLTPVLWPAAMVGTALTADLVRRAAGQANEAPAENVDADAFFGGLTLEEVGLDEAQLAAAKRFGALHEQMKVMLDDLQVWRIGRIQIAVYIVGRAVSGNWVGLSSTQIET